MEEVSHSGIIRSIGPEKTVVEIVSLSACASCHAHGLCSAADAASKEIEVPSSPGFSVGEEVVLVLRESKGMKAVLLTYVIPALLLLIPVVALSYTDIHELAVGGIGIGAVALWYLVLWLKRDRFKSEYVFIVNKK